MSWLRVTDNAAFLTSLFPDGGPSLSRVDLHEVQLNRDGPTVLLRFDLETLPLAMPPKWRASGFNTVQVRLMGIGIERLALSGWTTNNVGALDIVPSVQGIDVRFTGDDVTLDGCFRFLRVDAVSAYVKG